MIAVEMRLEDLEQKLAENYLRDFKNIPGGGGDLISRIMTMERKESISDLF